MTPIDDLLLGPAPRDAVDYLERIEAEHDEERKTLGVADELKELPGMTSSMLVALGKDGIKTVEDFAGYVPDDLVGWAERGEGETKRHGGLLDKFGLSRADAERMIMTARVKVGWITEEEAAAETEEEAEETEA